MSRTLLTSAALVCALLGLAARAEDLSVRVVTWNVLSNDWMDSRYDQAAVETLLGPIATDNSSAHQHDIYAVAVQENCYQCDKGNKAKLAEVFLRVLRRFGPYRLVGVAMTRNSNWCQLFACNTFQHGTAALLVFAREGLLTAEAPVHVNGCDGVLIHNAEKGIAGLRTVVKATGQTICFAGLHLDSKRGEKRRKCVTEFWVKARSEFGWGACDRVLMAGDFNTRPGPKERSGPDAVSWRYFGLRFFNESWPKDEMRGERPHGGVRLLDHIRAESGYPFEEPPVAFLPTYSIRPHSACAEERPCFKGTRTPAWTDRVICSGCGEVKLYTSVRLGKSDHDPVVAVFEL